MFSQAVVEKLQHYVYLLQDPRNDEIFYVGKGTGNRVFHHLSCVFDADKKTEKLDRIREIIASGLEVKHQILRHGLSEVIAFEIEASPLCQDSCHPECDSELVHPRSQVIWSQ